MLVKGGITDLNADFVTDRCDLLRYDLLELIERFFDDDFLILRFDFEDDLRSIVDLLLD